MLSSLYLSRNIYPLTAPIVIPWVKYFWKQRNTIMIGTEARAAPAIISPKSLDISLSLLAIPRAMVLDSALPAAEVIHSWN